MTRRLFAAAVLLLCAAPGARAQAPDSAAKETVIVTAPLLPAQIETLAHEFVVSYAAPAVLSGQLTRWRAPVCPRTDGLSKDEYTAYVSQRIRTVAAMAGAPVAATPCKPNIEILFTDKPQAILDQVHAKSLALLGYRGEVTVSHPIQAWYATGTADLAGHIELDREVFADIQSVDTNTGRHGQGGGTTTWTIPTAQVGGYRLRTDVSSEFLNVLIIADTTKTAGYQLGAIADYIAVMALSQTKAFESCQALPSITNLMAAACDPGRKTLGLTDGDLGYLKGVYRMEAGEPLLVQQADIVLEIKKALSH